MQTAAKPPQKPSVDLSVQVGQLLDDVSQKDEALTEAIAQIEQQKKQIAYYEKCIKLYEEAERLAKLQRFGQSSEKSRFQFNFFDEAELDGKRSFQSVLAFWCYS